MQGTGDGRHVGGRAAVAAGRHRRPWTRTDALDKVALADVEVKEGGEPLGQVLAVGAQAIGQKVLALEARKRASRRRAGRSAGR